MDFLSTTEKHRIKYYQVNRRFPLYPELVNLLRKVKRVPPDLLSRRAARFSDCRVVALTGIFVGKPRIETDLLFVGKIAPKKLEQFLKLAERFAGQPVSFTIFTPHEFEYRQVLNDRFVKNVLENNPVLAIDKLKHRK